MLLVPLTVKQIHSMQNMQAHAPEMKELQRKYKGDRQKLNEELMKFYKEKNINPASSCLPLLAQFPIFIGLYYTLRNFAKDPPPGDLSWLHFVPSIAEHVSATGPVRCCSPSTSRASSHRPTSCRDRCSSRSGS